MFYKKNTKLIFLGNNKILGDVFCLLATCLYGIANVAEEFLIKQNDRVEYLGMVGICGTIVSGIQVYVF